MIKRNISMVLAVISLFFCAQIHTSLAYFTTGQTAIKLNDTTALYTIDYEFGLNKQDLYMPIVAQRGLPWKSVEHTLGYTIQRNGTTTVDGTATGIVVANLPVVNGMYKIAKGAAEKMTLLVILTTKPNAEPADLRLQVDQLPFYADYGKSTLATLQLNPSELQYYVTPEVTLNYEN